MSSPPLPPRVRLQPGIAVHLIGNDLLAVGTYPGRAAIVHSPQDRAVLYRFLTSLHGRATTTQVLGHLPRRLRGQGQLLIAELLHTGLAEVVDPPEQSRRIIVLGSGELAAVTTAILRRAGVPHDRSPQWPPPRFTHPSRSILALTEEPGPQLIDVLTATARGAWHVLAVLGDGVGRVGPARTDSGSCAGCRQLQLGQADRLFARRMPHPVPVTPAPPGLAALTAGVLVHQILALSQGQDAPAAGVEILLDPGGAQSTVTALPVHPQCLLCHDPEVFTRHRRAAGRGAPRRSAAVSLSQSR